MNSLMSLVCVTSAALGLLLAITLLWRKNRPSQNIALAALVMLASLDLFVLFAKQVLLAGMMRADSIPIYINLLFASLLLQFLRASTVSTHPAYQWRWPLGWFLCLQSMMLLEIWTSATWPWLTIHRVTGIIVALVLATYLARCIRVIWLSGEQSNAWPEFHNRNVAQTSLVGIVMCQLLVVIASVVFFGSDVSTITNVLYSAMSCLLITLTYSFLYKAVSHGESALVSDPCKEKYGNNRLPDFVKESIISNLVDHMCREKSWLKIDLTLAQLADNLNVNPHHLSQIINSHFGKSFACFINEYRVNAACQSLAISGSKTVLEIALESGFSSKSSFNTLFKKQTGLTPSEYRKKFQSANCVAA